ncbi:MAG: Flp family type IVb pilin [Alphaproteobacteria bacterium]|jgi:pilus assembly protein Flp/PilA|nr:Flp family type IVb pilin [Alphaproteobacteria bacterium]
MKKLLAYRDAYLRNEDGATAIEYGLIAAGISLAIVGVVFTFGEELLAMFTTMEGKLAEANDNAEAPAP